MDMYQEFKSELKAIDSRTAELTNRLIEVEKQYQSLMAEKDSLVLLGESSDKLNKKLQAVKEEMAALREQIKAFGDRPVDKAKQIVPLFPDHKLHRLALGVQEEARGTIDLETAKLQELKEEAVKAKAAYIQLVSQIGDTYRTIFRAGHRAREAADFLPEDKKNKWFPPRVPEAGEFEIDDLVLKAYGNRPYFPR